MTCQLAVFLPGGKLPMLTVEELTEKWPYEELSLSVTPDKSEYSSVFTRFWIKTETVLVSFNASVVGIWFEVSSSIMSRDW